MPKSGKAAATVILIFFGLLAFREWRLGPDGNLRLHFLSVGQGDSTLVILPSGQKIMIDGGPDWSALAEAGEKIPFLDRRIDLLVLSHPDKDHMLSFPEFLRRYEIGAILLAGVKDSNPRYLEILALSREKNIPVIIKKAGETLSLPDQVSLSLIWPPKHLPKTFGSDANEASLVMLFKWHDHRVLFTGDIDQKVETALVAAKADLKADILKIAHHGSRMSSATGFLVAVNPSLALISVGSDNTYGHPHPSIINRLNKLDIPVHRTDLSGSLLITWER